ncbi:MAG: hypothetical protein PHV16_02730 [Candidatus Nanoarchaeia archaeon]|nr:hypothetical protein [Candidatus Nanoarchaeia archaeon]
MKLNEKNTLIYIIIAAIILASSVLVLRQLFHNGLIAGQMPYYNMNSAKMIIGGELAIKDSGYLFSPYHIFLAFAGKYMNMELASKMISLILGILSVIIFYFILKESNVKLDERFCMVIVLVFSPAFIYLSSFPNKLSIPVFLTLLGTYLLSKKNILLSIICFFSFAFAITFGIFNSVLVISIVIAYITDEAIKLKKLKSKKIPSSLSKAAVFLLLFFIISLTCFSLYLKPKTSLLQKEIIFTQIISDLGSLNGLGIFSLILGLVGFSMLWKKRKELSLLFLPLLITILFIFYENNIVVYLSFLISVFAGKAFFEIIKMEWEIKSVKNLTIILIVCGVLFSTISYINRVSRATPNEEITESLDWLKHYSMQDEIVFSHYSRGFWIKYFTDKHVIINQNFEYLPDAEKRFNDSNEIFYSRNLETTKELLREYSINYIWIDNEMKEGLVWQEKDEGLLFLFRNSETFKNIYNNQGVEIWEVKGVN